MLACVALAYALVQMLGGLRVPLDLDEAVYASQFSGDAPRIPFAAHRSLGEGLLAAPVTLWTSDVAVLRAYFALLSAALLYLAHRSWLKILDPSAVWVAAALFAVPWVSLRFGVTVLPNVPVALGAVWAAGALVNGDRRTVALIVAFLGLLRPTDALWIAIPLLAAALWVPARRRSAAWITAGLAFSCGMWLVESFVRFGDPLTRLEAIRSVNGASGLHFMLPRYLAALSGRESCPPTTAHCGPITIASALWWAGGLVLIVIGVSAARAGARRALIVCTVTAAVFGASYVVLSNLTVPRYLLPAYALLSLPAGVGTMAILRRHVIACVLAAGLLIVHAGLQISAASQASQRAQRALSWPVAAAAALAGHGVDGHCAVVGRFAPQIAYLRRCRAADMRDGLGPRDASARLTPATIDRLLRGGLRVALVTTGRPSGNWESLPVAGRGPNLYLSP